MKFRTWTSGQVWADFMYLASLAISSHQLYTDSSDYFYLDLEELNCYMKKEGSKRKHGPTFCFDFGVRFGDRRALHHIPRY